MYPFQNNAVPCLHSRFEYGFAFGDIIMELLLVEFCTCTV